MRTRRQGALRETRGRDVFPARRVRCRARFRGRGTLAEGLPAPPVTKVSLRTAGPWIAGPQSRGAERPSTPAFRSPGETRRGLPDLVAGRATTPIRGRG